MKCLALTTGNPTPGIEAKSSITESFFEHVEGFGGDAAVGIEGFGGGVAQRVFYSLESFRAAAADAASSLLE
jgi:hypothetical protein